MRVKRHSPSGGSERIEVQDPEYRSWSWCTRRDLQVLLLERADHPGYWQSVTGSQDEGETLEQTAVREVEEETGLDARSYVLQRLAACRISTRSIRSGAGATRPA